MTAGDVILRYIENTGIQKQKLAELLGVTPGALSSFLHYKKEGSRRDRLDYLIELSKFFGIPLSKLVEDIDE